MRLAETLLLVIARRPSRARSRLAYRVLVALVEPRKPSAVRPKRL